MSGVDDMVLSVADGAEVLLDPLMSLRVVPELELFVVVLLGGFVVVVSVVVPDEVVPLIEPLGCVDCVDEPWD